MSLFDLKDVPGLKLGLGIPLPAKGSLESPFFELGLGFRIWGLGFYDLGFRGLWGYVLEA